METYNYPNWLVSVEQAKKLKEIGFDLPCAFVLLNNDEIGFTTEGGNIYHLFDELDLNYNSRSSLVCVPTFEQSFEWFREKGFYSYIMRKSYPERYIYYIDYGLINYSEKNLKDSLLPKKYEEAREKLLNKLIELYGNSI